MKDCLFTLGVLGMFALLILGVMFFCFWITPYLPEIPPTPDPLNIYEDAYNRCQTRETLSDEQCHDAALREAYPD